MGARPAARKRWGPHAAAEAATIHRDQGRRHRDDAAPGPVQTMRCSRLQGFAPLTSPSCREAVASDATLDPSMGFVPLQGPLNSALPRRCQTGWSASRAEARRRPALPALQQAADQKRRQNPSRGSPPAPPAEADAEDTIRGAEAEPTSRLFSALPSPRAAPPPPRAEARTG